MGEKLSQALLAGRLELPTCQRCSNVQYPPSEICRHCLSDALEVTACDPAGKVIACALVHYSLALDFDVNSPWPIASVKMNAGPVVFAHALEFLKRDTAVTLVPIIDSIGDGVFGALANVADRDLLQTRFNRTI
ncbi:MAG: zinc ribbon domain-containing protein [Proteobacteria bacterium]|nr:zinc ribbon domain-containing protein [Pseudomonadota bacterium]